MCEGDARGHWKLVIKSNIIVYSVSASKRLFTLLVFSHLVGGKFPSSKNVASILILCYADTQYTLSCCPSKSSTISGLHKFTLVPHEEVELPHSPSSSSDHLHKFTLVPHEEVELPYSPSTCSGHLPKFTLVPHEEVELPHSSSTSSGHLHKFFSVPHKEIQFAFSSFHNTQSARSDPFYKSPSTVSLSSVHSSQLSLVPL